MGHLRWTGEWKFSQVLFWVAWCTVLKLGPCKTWTKEYLHSAIIKLYKRLLRCSADDHILDEEVLHRLAMPSPVTLLRVKRLSYLSSLLNSGPSAHWGLLNQDQTWLDLIRDDLQWMGDHLANSCNLGNPFEHTDRWLEIMRYHRGYWKRLIRRAREHSILLNSRNFLCVAAHLRVRTMLQEQQCWSASSTCTSRSSTPTSHFGCMLCGLRCKTIAGEGAHMNRTHGRVHPVRTLMDGTQCGACLKEYFTYSKLKHHLIRSDSCRQQLIGRKMRVAPLPGEGSTSNAALHHAWDGRLPPLQAEGPLPQAVCPRDFELENTDLFEAISLMIVEVEETDLDLFESRVRRVLEGLPISWTDCCRTLRCIQNLLPQAELHPNAQIKEKIYHDLERICDPETWQFLRETLYVPQTVLRSSMRLRRSLMRPSCTSSSLRPREYAAGKEFSCTSFQDADAKVTCNFTWSSSLTNFVLMALFFVLYRLT